MGDLGHGGATLTAPTPELKISMKRITSSALLLVDRWLGLGGSSGPTELDDGTVSQVLDMWPAIRRMGTPAALGGWFFCLMDNIHPAAGAIDSEVDPYNPGGAFLPNSTVYPTPVPADMDFWLFSIQMKRVSGAAGMDGAAMHINPLVNQQGWGIDNLGAAIAGNDPYTVGRWTGLDSTLAGKDPYGIAGDGSSSVVVNQRIGRGALLRMTTDADAACTFRTTLTCGLFAAGLGQDIAQ